MGRVAVIEPRRVHEDDQMRGFEAVTAQPFPRLGRVGRNRPEYLIERTDRLPKLYVTARRRIQV